MLRIIEEQFKQPKGLIGKIISKLMQNNNTTSYNRMINYMEIKSQENIFEIGYGPGLLIDRILRRVDCKISGIDFSELMYKEASKRNREHICSGKADLNYGNFLQYEMGLDNYDAIFCMNVVYFWNKLEIPFIKIKNSLKKNGRFCLYMDHPKELSKQGFSKTDIFNKYSIEQIVNQLHLNGFREIEYQYEKGYYVKCKK